MDIRMKNATIQLAQRQELQLVDAAGDAVTCLRGGLWITQHHDTRDIVLGPGERFVFDRPGLVIVRATAESLVSIAESAPAWGMDKWLTQRLRAWRVASPAQLAAAAR